MTVVAIGSFQAMMVVAAALLGALFGSFIATLVVRWPLGRSVAAGRSACDGCGTVIPAVRLLPLISFVGQRGRAACCGAAIDRIHPLTEVMAAAIGAISVAVAPDLYQAIAGALFGWMLLALALLDARHGWLPDRLTLPLALLGVATGAMELAPPLSDRLIGGIIAYLSFAAVRRFYRLLRHREGMGGGDVKLFGAIGLWLGWQPLPLVLLSAALAGLLWIVVFRLVRGAAATPSSVRFGVFLALSGWAVWLCQAMGVLIR